MKKGKGLLSIMLALVMVFAMMPLAAGTAYADDGYIIINGLKYDLSESDNEAVVTSLADPTITKVTIPATIKAGGKTYKVVGIDEEAFMGSNLTDLTVEGNNLEFIKEGAFVYCDSLTNVKLPDSLKTISPSAFGSSGIKSINIPEGIEVIDNYVFYACQKLESVTFPSTLECISDCAFDYCKALREVVIPEGVEMIGKYAFEDCENLEEITIPASVTDLGVDAFAGCGKLKNIYFTGTEEQWNALIVNSPGLPAGFTPVIAESIEGKAVVLAKTAFTFNGKEQKPAVKTVGGKALVEGTDFTVSFSASPKNAGAYTMTVKGIKKYKGTAAKATFKINKAANPMAVKGKTVKVKAKKLKKKAQTIKAGKAVKVSKAQGTMTYKLVSAKKGSKKIKLKKAKKQFKITAKTGKIKVKKKLSKGTYKLKIKVTAKGNANYNAKSQTVTVKVKIK